MTKVEEIVRSWVIYANPTPQQKSLAEYRASVCDSCIFRKEHSILKYPICGDCKCPLAAKIFSPCTKILSKKFMDGLTHPGTIIIYLYIQKRTS